MPWQLAWKISICNEQRPYFRILDQHQRPDIIPEPDLAVHAPVVPTTQL